MRRFRRQCINYRTKSNDTTGREYIYCYYWTYCESHSTHSDPTNQLLANNPGRLPVCEGDDMHSSNNDLDAPEIINLETSGLRRSQWIKSMMNLNNDGPTIIAYTSSIKKEGIFNLPKRKIPILEFFSVFCAVGELWSFTTSQCPHFHNGACHSFTSRVSNNYERINGLFYDTMNELCHQVKSYTTPNEAYTYKQILQ